MTTSLITKFGIDFDNMYARGNGTRDVYIYADDGTDIGRRYIAGNSGILSGWKDSAGVDVGNSFATSAAKIRRTHNAAQAWYYNVEGAGWETAFNEGFKLLKAYDINEAKFITPPENERVGQSADRHNWFMHAFKAWTPLTTPGTKVEAFMDTPYPGDGLGCFQMRTERISDWDLNIVLVARGVANYNHRYCNLTIQVTVPGVTTASYRGYFFVE